jgi:hypothetical protein
VVGVAAARGCCARVSSRPRRPSGPSTSSCETPTPRCSSSTTSSTCHGTSRGRCASTDARSILSGHHGSSRPVGSARHLRGRRRRLLRSTTPALDNLLFCAVSLRPAEAPARQLRLGQHHAPNAYPTVLVDHPERRRPLVLTDAGCLQQFADNFEAPHSRTVRQFIGWRGTRNDTV